MDRQSALTYLTDEYSAFATEAKLVDPALTSAYNTAIDQSLRLLSVQESDLATADVDQPNVVKYYALLDYFALDRFFKTFSLRFDVGVGNGALNAKRSQTADQTKLLLEMAENKLANLGIVIGSATAAYQMGRVNLDFLEPSLYPDDQMLF